MKMFGAPTKIGYYMETVYKPKLIENKLSGTPRCNKRDRLKKMCKPSRTKVKMTGWISSNRKSPAPNPDMCPARL